MIKRKSIFRRAKKRKVVIHQQHNMETVVFIERNDKVEIHLLAQRCERAKRDGRNHGNTGAKLILDILVENRRAKRIGRNPATGATLNDRFENRRAKRSGRNPAA